MKAIKSLAGIFVYIAVAAIVAMLMITVGDVIGRLIFARPIVGATEICEILMAVMLTAIGGSLLAGKTVQVDVFMDALPKKASLAVDTLMLLISVAYCFVVGWATFLNGQYASRTHRVYTFLNIPKWPFLMLLAFSFIVAGVATVCYILVLLRDKEKKKDLMDHADLTILEEADDE